MADSSKFNVALPLDRPRSDGQEETRRVVASVSIPIAMQILTQQKLFAVYNFCAVSFN